METLKAVRLPCTAPVRTDLISSVLSAMITGSFECNRSISLFAAASSNPHKASNSTTNSTNSQDHKRSLNIGTAIRTLSQDIPTFCSSASTPLCWTIYSSNITFHDRIHSLSLYGLSTYQTMINWSRSMIHLAYKCPKVEITKMHMQNDSTLAVRWRFTAQRRIPRIRAAAKRLTSFWNGVQVSQMEPKAKVMEGYFYYSFDEEGLISEHSVDQIEPPIQKINTLKAWFWWLGKQHQPSTQLPPM